MGLVNGMYTTGTTSPVSSAAPTTGPAPKLTGQVTGYFNGKPIYQQDNNPTNNYGGSGMSQSDFTKAYGTNTDRAAAASNEGATAASAGDAAANNPAINPNLRGAGSAPGTSPTSATPTYGTQSGPGILQQWFGERASGTDPAYEYTTGRGLKALDTAAAARGGFNGGASEQQDSDYLANMGAQRQGQLDTLAGGASNENANQISQMLGLGMGLAGGGAGTAGQYDTGAATDWTNAMNTGLSLSGQAAMIPYLARQQMMSQLMGGGMGMLSSIL